MDRYSRQDPFIATLSERYLLGRPGTFKHTYHLSLDLSEASAHCHYAVGDSLAVIPHNDAELVQRTLAALRCRGDALVASRHSAVAQPFEELLLRRCNITEVTRSLLALSAVPALQHLLDAEHRDDFKAFVSQREVWDFLEEYPCDIEDLGALADALQPLLPRFYSIASAYDAVGPHIDLIAAYLQYVRGGHRRWGVCTHYLCHLAPLHRAAIPIYYIGIKASRYPRTLTLTSSW